jgi:lipopolysaccharide/colanic/teichoic acid biosynthesis glycosyltransferase
MVATRQRRPGTLSRRQPSRHPRVGATVISEELFRDVLVRERKRADRSNQPLGVVLVTVKARRGFSSATIWRSIIAAVAAATRETDVVGWFERHETLGIALTELPASDPAVPRLLRERFRCELSRRLEPQLYDCVSIRLCMHPARATAQADGFHPIESLLGRGWLGAPARAHYEHIKRTLDILSSAMLLLMLSPLFAMIALLVKLTSRGPVLFRQERIGQMMEPFIMLKFRTMRVDADPAIHRQFVSSFIKSGSRAGDGDTNAFFKIVHDSRVTSIGRILRRTSLDELPQLWNVLIGDMSLVGPRPPLQYEVAQYEAWHRRRVLEAKPGLTGLWQVRGRSRTTFDEMVRLDLRYAKACSLSTDLRILLATPRAVISGKGAC